jgi:quinoprotein glucose dehydrogenase
VLCEVVRDGRKIAAVAQITKNGFVWVFDRDTGESLFPWREETVPPSSLPDEQAWPTQPVPLKPAPFARQHFTTDEITDLSPAAHEAVRVRLQQVQPHRVFDPPSERGTIIFPGYDGGAEWGGAAVDPDGVLYVNSNEMPWILEMVPTLALGPNATPVALYSRLCTSCHGPNREGSTGGAVPSLVKVGERLKSDEIVKVLGEGRKAMPSFGFLRPAQREAIARWLIDPSAPLPEPPAPATASREPDRAEQPFTGGRWTTTGYNRFFDPDGYPAVKPPWGTLNAIDLNTGEYRWRISLGELPELTAKGIPPTGAENYGGPVVTAGGLLFIGATKDEKFRAFDTRTGAKFWEFALPAGGYATPATYAVNGRQYVVIACGGGKMGTKSSAAWMAFALPE